METEEKVKNFICDFNMNLTKTASELMSGKWKFVYDKENDIFTWVNPSLQTTDDSLLFSIDNLMTIAVDKNTAEIEYFEVEYFRSVFIKENKEFKKFSKYVMKSTGSTYSVKKFRVNTLVDSKSFIERMMGKLVAQFPVKQAQLNMCQV